MNASAPRQWEQHPGGPRKKALRDNAERIRRQKLLERERAAVRLANDTAGAINRQLKKRPLSPEEVIALNYLYNVPSQIRRGGRISATALDSVESRLGQIRNSLQNSDQNYFKRPDPAFLRAHENNG